MPEPELPAGSLTFFFSDIEGSTRAAAQLGERFAGALQEHRSIVRAAFATNGGREVSTAGDSFFAVFEDAASALRAAIAVQRATAGATAAPPLLARIGIHSGHALQVGDDYVGLDIHRAARISDAGHGGQILVSEAARDGLAAELPDGVVLRDLGRHRLKDVGPQQLWQVEGDGLPAGPFPALRSLEAHPTNLPAEATSLVGRSNELATVRDLLLRERLVTITGAGGIGKTRLATAVARDLVPSLTGGVFYLDLSTIADAAGAIEGLSELLGAHTSADQDAAAVLIDRLRDRDLLLLLDTADRVRGLAPLVASLVGACPRTLVLVTSRSRLRVAAEHEVALGPLPATAAVELYAARASSGGGAAAANPTAGSSIRRLVERLDGIPLAIELAAARSRIFSPAVMLDRLERRLPALGEAGHDAPDRQRTLDATIAWSAEQLPEAAAAVFRRLGVLAGSYDLGAIEAVAASEAAPDVADSVELLVDQSLVIAESEGRSTRFRQLAPIRSFAAAALRASGEEPETLERQARHFDAVVQAAAAALEGEGAIEAVEQLGLDEPNIRLAMAWLLAEQPTAGIDLVVRLGPYWRLRGRVDEGLDWLARARQNAAEAPAELRASLQFWTGALLDDADRSSEAAPFLEESLELRRGISDEVGVARVMNSLGAVALSLGDLDRAEQLLTESIERKERLGDRRGIASSLSNLGIVAAERGDHALAVSYMRRAHAIDRELGGAYVVVGCANLASTLVRVGEIDEGLQRVSESLPGVAELGDPDLVVATLVSLASASLARGDALGAARLTAAADAIAVAEHVELHGTDRREVDDLTTRAEAALSEEQRRAVRADASAVDLPAALALARETTSALVGR